MSIESTKAKSPPGNPYPESGKALPPDPNHAAPSTNGDSVNGDTVNGDVPGAGAVGASSSVGAPHDSPTHASGETPANPDLPVEPLRNLPKWLLFNIVVPFLLLGAASGIVWMLGSVESASRPPLDDTAVGRLFALPAVDVLPVRSLKSTGQKLHLSADGTVVPFREVVLATEVAGQIVEKSPLCETGKYVTKDTVLMRIDPTDYELEVKRLQRLRQQEYEALGEVDQEMVNTKRSITLAKADIELQRRELKRQEALPNQFASQGELDQARRALLASEQQLVLYQNQLDLAEKRRARLESAEQLAAMQLEAAENNLRRTVIKAPITGVVVSEQAELNTFVARGSAVVTIEDTSKVEVAAKLRIDQLYWVLNQNKRDDQPSEDLGLAPATGDDVASENAAGNVTADTSTVGDRGYRLPPTPVTVRYVVSGRDGLVYQWMGKLVGYDGIGLDEQTRTVPVRIVVDEPQAFEAIRLGKVIKRNTAPDSVAGPTALVRGMFVKLRLELNPAVDLVVLPSEALKPGNRVWQFVSDPSVLDASILPNSDEESDGNAADSSDTNSQVADANAESNGDSDNTSSGGEADTEDGGEDVAQRDPLDPLSGFDPAAWVAGKLIIREDIRPVDRFVTEKEFIASLPAEGNSRSENGDGIDDSMTGQSWICEVPGGVLTDGSYVVVSPVGNMQSDVHPVRAPASIVVDNPPANIAELPVEDAKHDAGKQNLTDASRAEHTVSLNAAGVNR
ncbi:MAG: efflux RND transporter periplasmic adaptor subunit [Rhodopirellula sp. JB044]|uniref:efflux RND transporter periplasmic adaptor subunit n=1 Tax=Rhodopirellula sp. JB044 TaxID=3342844 RepID=UPI00370B9FA3